MIVAIKSDMVSKDSNRVVKYLPCWLSGAISTINGSLQAGSCGKDVE
jgi:hypothetical protein